MFNKKWNEYKCPIMTLYFHTCIKNFKKCLIIFLCHNICMCIKTYEIKVWY